MGTDTLLSVWSSGASFPGTGVSRGHQQWLRDEGTGNSLQVSLLPDPQPTRSGCIGLSRLTAPRLSQVSGALPQFPLPALQQEPLGQAAVTTRGLTGLAFCLSGMSVQCCLICLENILSYVCVNM